MMKIKKYDYGIVIFLTLASIGMVIHSPNFIIKSNLGESQEFSIKKAGYWELNKIEINNNWTETASTYDWCTGTGIIKDPYH